MKKDRELNEVEKQIFSRLGEYEEPPKKFHKKTGVRRAIGILVEMFKQHRARHPQTKIMLSSLVHTYLDDRINRKTLQRAKKALGIKSIHVGMKHAWTFPIHSEQKAIESLHDVSLSPEEEYTKEELEKEKRSVQILRDLMKNTLDDSGRRSYDHSFSDISELYCQQHNLSLSSLNNAKKVLGIRSLKTKNGFRWIYPAEEVQGWLDEFLGDQFVPILKIYSTAEEENGWSRAVIDLAREKLGGVGEYLDPETGALCWYNVGQVTPPK